MCMHACKCISLAHDPLNHRLTLKKSHEIMEPPKLGKGSTVQLAKASWWNIVVMATVSIGGYDYPLTDGEPDDDLKCMICLQVAQNPLQHELCGKLFCKDCLEKYGRSKPCPNCRAELSQYYSDNRSK